jgi:hypothetical protein
MWCSEKNYGTAGCRNPFLPFRAVMHLPFGFRNDNYRNKRIKDMAKDYRKKKKSCVPLDGYQAEQLARLIIAETERKVHYGTERKKRIAAPSGAVILF